MKWYDLILIIVVGMMAALTYSILTERICDPPMFRTESSCFAR